MSKQLYEKIGEEYKPINPIIKLDNIIDSISENSILSVLLKSNHYYIEYSNSIKATRNKVPLSLRRKGLWISYINGKEDITECFIGKNDEIDEHWSDDNNWKNLTYIKVEENSITYQHLNDNLKRTISEYKNVTNFADDEDLMTEGNVLKLANKEYNPNTFSGLGEVIIRKNIKNINGKNKNIITKYNFNKENTIYIVKYDFDLNGNVIDIPKNSVLRYKGGSLNNGALIYADTIIEGIERLNNVVTVGNYTYPYIGNKQNSNEQLAPTLAQVRKLSTEVTNIADDEDLTKIYDSEKGQKVLQLKDRQYVQGSNSGMGYIILRKGKSFEEQLTKANTIYEIRYDFDLGGRTVKVPENCTLKFNGGKLINGTINADKEALIVGGLNHILDSVTLKGYYKNSECNISWWGAKRGEGIDNSDAVQFAFNSSIPIINVSGKYYMSSPVSLPYNKVIKGRTGNNNLLTGFIANNDFSSKYVDFPARYGKEPFTQEVFGMFYHRDTTKLEMHDIFIDCAYHANYAIEHIDLYGSCDMYNCYISKANNVGILQYACENPIYDQLFITDCHIGLVVSNHSYIDSIDGRKTNPMELECFTSKIQGSPNIIYTSNLRCLHNNYGAIFNGCLDIKFESFETAHNAIVGAIVANVSISEFSKYYSEGDADCDFYIHDGYKDTVADRISNGELLEKYSAHPLLVGDDLDGKLVDKPFLFRKADGTYKKTKVRAPLFFVNSHGSITSAMISIDPRSKEMDDPTYYELPTEENIYGVDSLIMSYESSLSIGGVAPYVAPNNINKKTYYTRYIDIKNSSISILSTSKDSSRHKNPITPLSQKDTNRILQDDRWYTDRRMYNVQYYLNYPNFANLNTDIETRRYDLSYQSKDFRVAKILSHWNNIPLYGGEKMLTRGLYLTKEKFLQKFGALRVVKVYGVIEVMSDEEAFRGGITATFYKDNYSTFVFNFSNDQGGVQSQKKGIYENTLFIPVITDPDVEYDNVVIMWNSPVKTDTVAYSDLFFYDVTDNTPYVYQNETLSVGKTDQRPDPSYIGQRYFDTTLVKDIIWTGTKWVDAMGTEV